MPKGALSCTLGNGCSSGAKAVLEVVYTPEGGRRIGILCEACARHDYSLHAFLVAAGWLHGWRNLRFNFLGAGKSGRLHEVLQDAIDGESSRADEARLARLERRQEWATKGLTGIRY